MKIINVNEVYTSILINQEVFYRWRKLYSQFLKPYPMGRSGVYFCHYNRIDTCYIYKRKIEPNYERSKNLKGRVGFLELSTRPVPCLFRGE